ncbi:MAG: leucyl aminopeptidase family protein [Candidatus Eremiobacterota bacterium]
MEINVKEGKLSEISCDALIIGLHSELTDLPDEIINLDKELKGKIKYIFDEKEITGKSGEITVIHTFQDIKPKRVVIAGMGKAEDMNTNQLRETFSMAVKKLKGTGCKNLAIVPPYVEKFDTEEISSSIVEGILLGLYNFTKYLTLEKEEKKIEHITFAIPPGYKIPAVMITPGIKYGTTVSRNVNIVKDICNEPSNYMTPDVFGEQAKKLFDGTSVKCTVLNEKEIAENNMNLLLAVGQGSVTPPRLVVLEYIKDKNAPVIGLVGKGITFDTGGITLKQSKSTLFEMKRDLTGGAVVMGIMKTLEEFNCPLNCVAVIPLAENAIGNMSCKPGDIFYSMSGKTVEIFDTDCEGRLILADAFTYIQKYYSPKLIIDLATLLNLGSVMGLNRVPFFTNSEEIIPKLQEASRITGEEVWQMPLDRKFRERIMSHFADRKNRSYKDPQTISIALFLEDFIDDGVEWLHLDLAAVDTKYGDRSYVSRGSTAFGVRLVTRLLFDLLEKYHK